MLVESDAQNRTRNTIRSDFNVQHALKCWQSTAAVFTGETEGKTRENLALFSLFLQWMTLNFDASHFVLLQLGLIAN